MNTKHTIPHGRIGALLLAVALLGIPAQSAKAQAYCALRDPVQSINILYPGSTKYESIVKFVGGEARNQIKKQLPFTLHFNELGKHTLYVVKKGKDPLGLVHVRSEKGQWGLVEVVWAFDLDLKIQGFRFQRCRNRHQKELEQASFIAQLKGKGLAEILLMLNAKGNRLNRAKIKVSPKAAPLALAVLRSGLKTLAVTSEVWTEELEKLGKKEEEGAAAKLFRKRTKTFFPSAQAITPVLKIYDDRVLEMLKKYKQQEEWVVERKSVVMAQVRNDKKVSLGYVLKTRCSASENLINVWWGLNDDGKIIKVAPVNGWPDEEFETAFIGLPEIEIDELSHCSTPAQLAALEVIPIVHGHLHR